MGSPTPSLQASPCSIQTCGQGSPCSCRESCCCPSPIQTCPLQTRPSCICTCPSSIQTRPSSIQTRPCSIQACPCLPRCPCIPQCPRVPQAHWLPRRPPCSQVHSEEIRIQRGDHRCSRGEGCRRGRGCTC